MHLDRWIYEDERWRGLLATRIFLGDGAPWFAFISVRGRKQQTGVFKMRFIFCLMKDVQNWNLALTGNEAGWMGQFNPISEARCWYGVLTRSGPRGYYYYIFNLAFFWRFLHASFSSFILRWIVSLFDIRKHELLSNLVVGVQQIICPFPYEVLTLFVSFCSQIWRLYGYLSAMHYGYENTVPQASSAFFLPLSCFLFLKVQGSGPLARWNPILVHLAYVLSTGCMHGQNQPSKLFGRIPDSKAESTHIISCRISRS